MGVVGGAEGDPQRHDAILKLAALPAANLGLARRGLVKPGMFADVVVFDPATIADRATFEKPHTYAVGMRHVFVNGVQVLKDGEHTGKKPGRALIHQSSVVGPQSTSVEVFSRSPQSEESSVGVPSRYPQSPVVSPPVVSRDVGVPIAFASQYEDVGATVSHPTVPD